MLNEKKIKELSLFDTPTICNALELMDENRKSFGFTTEQFFCLNPKAEPIVGIAKTASVRSLRPSAKTPTELIEHRAKYYTYVGKGKLPKICVMQDLDGIKSCNGAFWGTFNSSIHKALNCKGVITDGAIRDITKIPKDFQMLAKAVRPSHGFVHIVDFGIQVNVASMIVNDGDLIHADLHGAVSFPVSYVDKVIINAKEFIESEKPIIQACRKKNITLNKILEIYKGRVEVKKDKEH